MDLSVIIVSYNTRDLTINTIKSVIDTAGSLQYEIIVVDNASSDDSVLRLQKEFKDSITVIVNSENLGFSKANNQAMKVSKGDYVLLLNSDTIVHPGALESSFNYIKEHQSIGALGCKVLLRDGSLDKACKRGFPTPWNSFCYALKLDRIFPRVKAFNGYHLNYLSNDETHEVECIMGAYMLLPRQVLNKVGGLDEDFFMYGEDVDWCYRIKEAGYSIVYYPQAVITHYKKASFAKRKEKTIIEFYRSMEIFYHKHYKDKYSALTTLITYGGIRLQLWMALLKNKMKK